MWGRGGFSWRGRGWGHGGRGCGGWRWYGFDGAPATSVKGYTYVGPCRCGFGPHAYYMDTEGKLVHASQIFSGAAPYNEMESLKKEKEELERRLKDIESRIRENEK
ncbi:conserved hypothetical protein [Thermosulfidibacter takaii ABI70S6]|uniref:DUF5320 domain-containing protein n=1 Tax=Thermosulfidibacter takaii (strain DSM 17441 / JCM 13301 / NBRC 103674 / ABI70S6) TaxID=1298851 RepID=A0A0S3QUU0_THET7|nr:hypothetical protein [Thermosulfidibacter takaii]BAT72101.1 conserved hypothetical protein [Thermosulfidibacter takaii ABI70S6]